MPRLNTYVHAVERDEQGNTTRSQTFGPDEDVPDWAVRAITNPDVWAEAVAATDEPSTPGTPEPDRPRGNASRDEWAAYAKSKGVRVADNSSRDVIIAAVDRAAG